MNPNVVHDAHGNRAMIVPNFERLRQALEADVDKSCNEFLNEPDWQKNIDICDKLNRTDYLCPFAIAAIRRKLKTKNPEVEILALHLLEAIIKNVPSAHGAIAQPSFMRYIVKVALDTRKQGVMKSLGKKLAFKKDSSGNKAHLRAQTIDKALIILAMLHSAYANNNTFPIFHETYNALSQQGVRFPALTKDESSTVFAPMHSHKFDNYGKNFKAGPSALGSVAKNGVTAAHANIDRSLPMIKPITKIEGLQHPELINAQNISEFMYDMLNTSEPGSNIKSNELIQEILPQLTDAQQKVILLLNDPIVLSNEILMSQSLAVNEIVLQVLADHNGLADGTKRRYEEGLGNIKDFAKQETVDPYGKNNSSGSDSSQNNKDKDDSKAAAMSDNESVSLQDEAFAIAPPPTDEGGHTHHSRRSTSKQKDLLTITSNVNNKENKNNQNKNNNNNDDDDLLSMFSGNNNNNNNSNHNQNESHDNILDIMGIPSSNNNNNNNGMKIDLATMSTAPLTQIGEQSIPITDSVSPQNMNSNIAAPMNSAGNNGNGDMFADLDDPFAALGAPDFGDNAIPPPADIDDIPPMSSTTTTVTQPISIINKQPQQPQQIQPQQQTQPQGQVAQTQNSSDPFLSMIPDPFAGMMNNSNTNTNINSNLNNNSTINTNVNANTNINIQNQNNPISNQNNMNNKNNNQQKTNPFDDINDPFASLGSGSLKQVSNTNNNNNSMAINVNNVTMNNNGNNDDLGDLGNPFAMLEVGGNTNNTSNAPKDDFLGDASNPFAGL